MKYTVYFDDPKTFAMSWKDMNYSKTFESGREATEFEREMENQGYITDTVDEHGNAIY